MLRFLMSRDERVRMALLEMGTLNNIVCSLLMADLMLVTPLVPPVAIALGVIVF